MIGGRYGSCFASIAMFVAVGLTVACGDSADDDSGGDYSNKSPEQACNDTADAVAGWADRCGKDADKQRRAFVDTAADGDCGTIVEVRDKNALYDKCIPAFGDLPCEGSVSFPSSCQNQLLRPDN